jgi:hypothetical protein
MRTRSTKRCAVRCKQMKCANCKTESNVASRICPSCGRYMSAEIPEMGTPDSAFLEEAGQDRGARPLPRKRSGDKPRRKRQKRRSRLTRKKTYQTRMVNWVKVGMYVLVFVLILLAGVFIWMNVTPAGQLVMARMGRNASADAYWALGTEYLDQGYIPRSIEAYMKAEEIDPDQEELDKKLLLLAEAYEAAGQTGMAEKTYVRIYTDIKPEDPVAYRQTISILLSQDRLFEAVNLMQLAYDKTKEDAFLAQRSQLVPEPPTASLPSGRHMYAKTVEFISSQGYEIFYTTEDGPLPETGTLYTGPLTLNEGTYNFRVVAVSSQLISNEMAIRYTITMPTPMAPKTNMESKTYERPIRVSLRIVDEDDKEVTLYYTIDGTKPTIDSPRYTGESILLTGGRVTLRAIAVNRYGKRSNEMIVEYKISTGFKKYFRNDDQFQEFELLKTTLEGFTAKMGQPTSQAETEDRAVTGAVTQLTYPWGEARFFKGEDSMLLYHVSTNLASLSGPRGSKVGMQMEEVTDKFRDMGQLPNDRGSRGIYYNIAEGYARYTVASDNPLNGLLEYTYVGSLDGTSTILNYEIEGGRVTNILLRYMNSRLSMVE